MNKDSVLKTPISKPLAMENQPPPYHAFEHLGEFFVYDTYNCAFFHIDEPTKIFLDLCLEMSIDDAKIAFERNPNYNDDTKINVMKEVEIMGENGLFLTPNYTVSYISMEKQLRHRYESIWNKLELSLSEGCNLACKYCYCATSRDIPEKGLMSERVAKAAVNWLFAHSGKSEMVSITLFGGEPLLNKPVLKFVVDYSQKLAKLHGKRVFYSMTTNGTLLDDEIISYIKRYNFGLMVSLDGPKELHDNQCPTQGGKGSFDSAAAGIKRLMSKRRSVTVRGTMIRPLPNILELVKFYEDFGFTRIVLGKATNPANPSRVDCSVEDFNEYYKQSREEIVPWLLEKLKKGERPKYYPYSAFVDNFEKGKVSKRVSPFRCGVCRGTTTVGADGILYPCHRFVGMGNWEIGNIFDGPNYEACKSFWRDYNRAISNKCTKCWKYSICKAPCPWELANSDGTFRTPYQCEYSEEYIKNGAYILLKKQALE